MARRRARFGKSCLVRAVLKMMSNEPLRSGPDFVQLRMLTNVSRWRTQWREKLGLILVEKGAVLSSVLNLPSRLGLGSCSLVDTKRLIGSISHQSALASREYLALDISLRHHT